MCLRSVENGVCFGVKNGVFFGPRGLFFSVREFGLFRTGNLVLGVSDGTEKDASF